MKVPVILGPTAIGKTKLAIELAKAIDGEIISADSMQVYRGMDIGTAKPTLEERQRIPHYLIDIRNPDEEWTVSDFVGEAQKLINKIPACHALPAGMAGRQNNRKTPIIVGGTGLYLWSLLEGFAFPISPADKELRARLEKESAPTLYSRLSTVDLPAAQKIHPNDKKRIIRALEVFELTGKTISELQELRTQNSKLRTQEYTLIGLDLPRDILYERINQRIDQMIARGLIDEVKGLLAKGYPPKLNAFQALGYKEVITHLNGTWTKEEMIEELKKRSRHFARRQLTWFRRFKDVKWYFPAQNDAIIKLCQGYDNKR